MTLQAALNATDWKRLNRLLEQALEVEAGKRLDWIHCLPPEEADLKPVLEELFVQADLAGFRSSVDSSAEISRVASKAIAAMRREQAGQLIGRWRLVRLLAEGGMGSVWLANSDDQRSAALKVARTEWLDLGFDERLARESDVLSKLQHPNIARFYEAGIAESGRPFLALEYIEGEPIDRYCRRSALRLEAIIGTMVQVIRAVAHAHSRLVVHRDLKPSNILVLADGTAKLLDFGIAKILGSDSRAAYETELTRFAGRPLTLSYAAPEQILGEQITVATDIYSLGVILYELITEVRPYRPREDTIKALEAEVLRGAIERPSAVALGKSRAEALRGDLDDIVMRALQRDPDRRYGAASALADDLENYLHGTPLRGTPSRRVDGLGRIARRNAATLGAALSAILILFAALGGSWWEAHRTRERAARAIQLSTALLLLGQEADPTASARKRMGDVARLAAIEDEIEREFARSPDQLLHLRVSLGEAYLKHEKLDEARRVFRRAAEEGAITAPPNSPYVQRAREGIN